MANAYALSGTNLLTFDTASPTNVTTIPITGITAGETLVGIDVRPQNGLLYGLGVNAGADTATLYVFAPNGVAGVVGVISSFTTDGTTPVNLPDPATVGYGFDFNPAADRIRVTAGALNFRINPNTGDPVDGDNTGLTTGTVTGTNPDGALTGGTTTVDASAYTNNQPNGTASTLYTLDASSDSLFIQQPANTGAEALVAPITLNGSPLNFTTVNGFDIPAGVNTVATGTPVTTGSGFAVLNVGGTTGLYSINLVNGQATFIGNVANGTTAVQGLAIHSDLGGLPVIAIDAAGANLLRFNTASPGTVTTQALGTPVIGETLIGIDYRPATGQLYAMGVDPIAETGTLYRVDPQNGGLTTIGAASGIAFTGINLPDPATGGYGFDFNPDVDRIRVTTSTGLNFRVNPITGLGVDSDPGTAGTQPDGPINGSGSAGVSATAYTNSFGNDVAVTATTLYTLDAASNKLFIQNPPNNGTETNGVVITVGGTPLDFTDVSGFDIPESVRVASTNSPATGFGFAALTVSGTTGLYQIDLVTGQATALGSILTGATQIAGLTLGNPTAHVTILSNGGGDAANVALAENTTAVTTVLTVDPLLATTFSISGGADAAKFQINAVTGALSFISAPDFETPTDVGANNTYVVTVRTSDAPFADSQTITVTVTDVNEFTQVTGTQGDDVLGVPTDPSVRVDALGGVDTASFNFKLTDAIVSYVGNKVIFDTASQHIETTGIEKYVFTDGTVNNRDNDALVDDLFYYSHNHDVWNAHVDADAHFHTNGFKEGRDPSAFFDTSVYLAINPAVKAAGTDPLTHYSQIGWKEGRITSLNFDPAAYLAANPDVKAAGAEPLAHFLTFGGGEGRQPIAPTEYLAPNGFDYVYYLTTYSDVLAAGVDPFQHFQTVGWKEGRNPNALFDTNGYLAAYTDVANAHINPLDHYHAFGFKEGRDPSVGFDTVSYRSAYPDVAAANVDPLAHFLDFGRHEGRSAFADGVFG